MPIPTPEIISTAEVVGILRQLAADVATKPGPDQAEQLHRLADVVEIQSVVTPIKAPVRSYSFGTADGYRIDVRAAIDADSARLNPVLDAVGALINRLDANAVGM